MAKTNRPAPDLPGALRALDEAAHHKHTPCGAGSVHWRMWGESGPPLILLHGGAGSWLHWARNIPRLSQHYRTIVPDLPGLGQSALPPDRKDPLSFAQALASGLETILGPRPSINLVGFSFGSIVAGQLAAATDADVKRLVLVGPGALGVSRLPRELVKVRALEGAARVEAHRENLEILMFADGKKIDETALAIQDWNSRHARVDSRPIARGTSLRDALARRGKPFAAIIGEKDATAQPPFVVPVLRGVDPAANIRVLPGIGHWCMYEGADLFEAALRDMFARLGSDEVSAAGGSSRS